MRWRLLVLFTAVGVISIGCGGDKAEPSGPAVTEFTVEMKEFDFVLDRWTVRADTDVTITLRNTGTVDHEWVILKAGVEISSESEFDEDMVAFEVEAVAAGETAVGTFDLPPGEYQVICAIPGHFDAGMEGRLFVEG